MELQFFLDKNFVKRYDISLLIKIKPIHVKVVDGCLLLFEDLTYKTIYVEVAKNDHNSLVIFNTIRTSFKSIIVGLF